MADQKSPGQDLADSVRGIYNGDNIRKSLSDAWDRLTASAKRGMTFKSSGSTSGSRKPPAKKKQGQKQDRGK